MIRKKGKKPVTHIADQDEFRKSLINKIIEEASELTPKPSQEEIADVLEATYALIGLDGFSREEIERARQEKAKERGSFDKRIILEKVE